MTLPTYVYYVCLGIVSDQDQQTLVDVNNLFCLHRSESC